MYATMGTHPDIAFTMSTVAQFSENPGWVHWEAIKHIFHYPILYIKRQKT